MYRFVTALSVLLLALPALAGDFDSGSDGSDGPLNCETLGLTDCASTCSFFNPCEVQILLGLAETGPWDSTPHTVGVGVYDPVQWAVVYHYTTIEIPEGVIVTFANHRNGAPVMWLATEDVMIAGSVRVDGADGSNAEGFEFALPGPGGFGGGIGGLAGSTGFGPGGGSIFSSNGGGGGYGSAGHGAGGAGGAGGGVVYGRDSIVPLIGGSGGSNRTSATQPGGAGGGAILIASSGSITLASSGGIFANGGNTTGLSSGSGSGGGIRLVAHAVSGSGMLRAVGGTTGADGGVGRIRVDAFSDQLEDRGDPLFSMGLPAPVFPAPAAPRLRATAVSGNAVPIDPLATVLSGDVAFTADGEATIEIEAQNVPVGLTVTVRIVQKDGGADFVFSSDPLAGKFELSNTTVMFNFSPPGAYEVHLSLQLP